MTPRCDPAPYKVAGRQQEVELSEDQAAHQTAQGRVEPRSDDLGIGAFQTAIEDAYFDRDSARGVDGSFTWFVEEVGELAKEIRQNPRDKQRLTEEMSDVLAWLTTLASLLDISMTDCARRYADGCPKCHGTPCVC